MAIDFRQYTIRNCRDKRLSVPARKYQSHPKEIIKRKRYQVPGRPAPIHSALIGGSRSPRSDGLTLPEARL